MMRAVQLDRCGGPEVLTLRELPVPAPGRGQVLVRVRAAGVNPTDVTRRRLPLGRFPRGTGVDFAGEIVAGTGDLAPGRQVWGYLGAGLPATGTAADFVVVRLDRVGPAPATIDAVTAAALPVAGLTAVQALRDAVRLKPGHRLLVIGASGGVGSIVIQLATAQGAHVTAVSSARNADFCRELGAGQVIDYAAVPPAGRDYDALVDCHGAELRRYLRLLRPGGRAATIAAAGFAVAARSWLLPGPRVRIVMVRPRRADLDILAAHLDAGRIRPVIEEVFPLSAVREAHRAVESGHARGKRVLDLALTP